MPTTGDDAIDSAFSDAPSSAAPTVSTGDDAIDSAFGSKSVSPSEKVAQLVRHEATSAVMYPAALLRHAYDVTLGNRTAAEADARQKAFMEAHTTPITDPTAQQLGGIYQGVQTSNLNPLSYPGKIINAGGDALSSATGSPELGAATKDALGVAGMLAPGVMKAPASAFDTQAALDKAAATGKQSMGAAATAPQIAQASPQLQAGFKQAAQSTGGAVNPTAAANHLEADRFGIQLTRGQATRDPAQFSNEQNSTHPDIVRRLNEQNTQMTDALDSIRREAAPGAVQNNPIENGQTVVDALKAHDEPVQADIRAKYKALTDANGGSVPIDPSTFLGKVDTALKKNYLTNSVPPAASELLNSVRNGEPLDFEGFEAARSRLAEAQREGGSSGQAARIIRGELEQMPLSPAAAHLKGIADTARSAAKARFDALDADPAYQAAVNDVSNGVRRGEPSPLADSFLDKYALGKAPKVNVDTMMSKLDPDAREAVISHTLSAIRKGAIPASGKITPAGFQAALDKYGPKMDSLVPSETQESLESLSNVVRNAVSPPAGHFVNYSKSGVVLNAAKGVGQKIGEGVLNAKTFGMGVPILKGIGENKFAKHALAPGAGLDDLKTTP